MDKWISVEDRLPKSQRRVLVYGKEYLDRNTMFESNRFYWDAGAWSWTCPHRSSLGQDLITHWMPLPEPPKAQRKDGEDE